VWTLLVRYDSWSAANRKSYIYRLAKMNFLITDHSQNWKTLRLWADNHKYPNLYVAENNGRIYVGNQAGLESGYWANLRTGTMDWVQEEYLKKSLDAIHLAVASLEGARLVTADRNPAEPAKILGMDVVLIEPGK